MTIIDRRSFLVGAGAYAGVCAAGLGTSPSAFALDPWSRRERGGPVLILFFLRGGADGLSLLVPHGDEAYYALRQQIAIRRPGEQNGALDLDGFFGLHPSAKPLLEAFRAGDAVALTAVGNPSNTRSHFEEQDVFETGSLTDRARADGILNRHLASAPGRGPIRAVALGGRLPRILRGPAPALAFEGLDELSVGDGARLGATLSALHKAYGKKAQSAEGLLAGEGLATLDALRELEDVAARPYETKVSYPTSNLGRRAREAARLVKADLGVEVVELDYGGWDTHQNQGGASGPFANLVADLSASIAALREDLGEIWNRTLVLTLTEFGRTAAQNGTGGTDHGWASCALAAGGSLRRDKPRMVLGEWPGLGADALNQGRDLAHSIDFRDVVVEAVGKHLGNERMDVVLPGHEARAIGLI
ncbi:MAG: DUF1501 domain-containing protein [bacterium]|nr:DUF1501 domain-containing protein [bacterium]